MEKLWGIVLQASLYGMIVGSLILLVKKLLNKNLNGRFHYLIWMILIVKLIVPIGPSSEMSIFNQMPNYNNYNFINENKEVYEATGENIKSEVEGTHNNIKNNSSIPSVAPNKNISNSIKDTIKGYLPYIWIAGVINVAVVLLFSQYLLYKKIKNNNRKTSDDFYTISQLCKNKMKVNKNIRVVVNDFINTPSLVGFINPKILIPNTMTNLSNKELEYIILHELAHYKRKDILFNYLLLVLQAIHWFNPVIWYLFKRVREDMELATDEMVLKVLEDEEHKEYGKAILTVLEKIKSSKLTPGVLGIIEDKNSIKNRIKRIKDMKLNKNKQIIFTIIGIVVITILSAKLLTSSNASTPKNEDFAQILYEYKSPYVGDASNVSNLIEELPLSEYKYSGMELMTTERPYGIKVTYLFNDKQNINESDIYSNSAVLFALIDNLEYIEYTIKMNYDVNIVKHFRHETSKFFDTNLDTVGQSLESFRTFIKENDIDKKDNKSSKRKTEDLDSIISNTLIKQDELSIYGEVVTEGHVILDTEENKNSTKVYLVSSGGTFGFENEIFTMVSGYGLVPMVMTIQKDKYGNVDNVSVEWPQDGSYYVDSIKKMLPKKLHKYVFNNIEQYRHDIESQQEAQAKVYLDKIGRDAKIQAGYVVKEDIDINTNASNTLLEDPQLADYPTWLGTRESVVDGVRYIYEKSHYNEDGYDFIVYTKKYGDNAMEQYTYKINGSKPELVGGSKIEPMN